MHIFGRQAVGLAVMHIGCIGRRRARLAPGPDPLPATAMQVMCIGERWAADRAEICITRRRPPTEQEYASPAGLDSPNMTGFDMYGRHADGMMNIELARILQEDREREIAADIRARRLLQPTESTATQRDRCAETRPLQRRPSTGAAAR